MPAVKLKKAATATLLDNLGLDSSETLLVIADENLTRIGQNFFEAGREIAPDTYFLQIPDYASENEEPNEIISMIMQSVDVIVIISQQVLTDTKARRSASRVGVRIASLHGVPSATITRCLNSDAHTIKQTTDKLGEILSATKQLRITSDAGTDIVIPVNRKKIYVRNGFLNNIGDFGNLPAGEVIISPIENKANGKIVIDGSISQHGFVKAPIVVEIEDGHVSAIHGDGEDARELAMRMNKSGRDSKVLAAFGIGTNYKAKVIGNTIEDKKVEGAVHFSFGVNSSPTIGVDSPLALDTTSHTCSVIADNQEIVAGGKLLQ